MSAALRRRQFCGSVALAPLLAGCDRVLSALAAVSGEGLLDELVAPRDATVSDEVHLLSRASFGPRPGDLGQLRKLGREGYLEQQLYPDELSDPALSLRTALMDTPNLPRELLFAFPPEQIETELSRHALLSAVYARAQLREVMVEFFVDHFNVAIGKGDCQSLLPVFARDVIRKHAFGSFRELLGAVTLSPAMLVYLDGKDNVAALHPNENHARELLELHTLGVDGGYTQRDVQEVARTLTGYVVAPDGVARGEVHFVPARHDDGGKQILGTSFAPGGGEGEISQLLDLLATHPSTARHLSRALCAHFVSDQPPAPLVAEVAQVFSETDGDLRACVRFILNSPSFGEHRRAKLKRPFRFVVSALRALAVDTHAKGPELEALTAMGQRPFAWPTPDGYPRESDAWLTSLPARFRFAFELMNEERGGPRVPADALAALAKDPDDLPSHLFGRRPTDSERVALGRAESLQQRLALGLASPAFQRY